MSHHHRAGHGHERDERWEIELTSGPIPVWINMRPKHSLKTGMAHFLSSGIRMTHLRKFKDRPYTLLLEKQSRKVSISLPAASSTSVSILGNGKLSLGHALLRSIKSMHIRHFPFFFLTITMFASQVVNCTSLMSFVAFAA